MQALYIYTRIYNFNKRPQFYWGLLLKLSIAYSSVRNALQHFEFFDNNGPLFGINFYD